jgi:hypothetical protein
MRQIKQIMKQWIIISALVGCVTLSSLITGIAQAEPTYVSPNYGVDEVFMGAGGLNDATSANYSARASLGDISIGNVNSASLYQAYGGYTTTTDPFIEFTVTGGTIDLGYLTDTATSYTTGTFTVRTYLAEGYSVITASDPPKVSGTPGTHMLATNGTPTAPTIGTEQFGINLAANTSPASVGADPVQIPDATYSFGQVESDYSTPNLYKYTKGDRIAYSNKSSGTTQFTITYIYNIDDLTLAGEYVFNHILVATSVY